MRNYLCTSKSLKVSSGNFSLFISLTGYTRWLSWLSRKFAGSIPDDVIEIFYSNNPSGNNMVLSSIQLLNEMSTRAISWE
jgi:hypothetical protein